MKNSQTGGNGGQVSGGELNPQGTTGINQAGESGNASGRVKQPTTSHDARDSGGMSPTIEARNEAGATPRGRGMHNPVHGC